MKTDFFIVGAPKCGTTSLSEYLSTHPHICMAYPKEPSYFCDDFPNIRLVTSEGDYMALFSHCDKGQCLGDASTAYLLSKTAISNIRTYNPRAKIIIILRNPLEMLPSWHGQMIYSLFENEKDFQKAYELQDARKKGRMIPNSCREASYLWYRDVARFDLQLQRVYESFPSDQVLVIVYDDFIKNTRATYLEVLNFINVPDDGRTVFPAANASKAARFGLINQLIHNPPGWLWKLLDAIRHTPAKNILYHAHKLLKGLNTVKSKKATLDPAFARQLKQDYRGAIDNVSRLINRDLSHWYQ